MSLFYSSLFCWLVLKISIDSVGRHLYSANEESNKKLNNLLSGSSNYRLKVGGISGPLSVNQHHEPSAYAKPCRLAVRSCTDCALPRSTVTAQQMDMHTVTPFCTYADIIYVF
jgi:hypothetical protein